MITILQRHRQTDEQTDRPTTCLGNTTLRVASRGKNNSFVRCLTNDFSRAFDSVHHAILLSKSAHFNIPSALVSWIRTFLTGRTQMIYMCKIN